MRMRAFVASLSASFVCLLSAPHVSAQINDLEVHFVDVGQGDCTVLVCPNGNNILVDCGSGNACSRTASTNYVRAILDGELHALVITHPDSDHYSLVGEALSGITPEVVMRPAGSNNEYDTCNLDDWLEARDSDTSTSVTPLAVEYHDATDTPNPDLDCGDADIYVLAANVQSGFSPANTESIVLLVRYNDFEVILTGDATLDTEEKILEWYTTDWLNAEVYKIPHHGSSTTSPDQELGVAASPRLAIASAGANSANTYGHPRKAAFRKLYSSLDRVDRHQIYWCRGQRDCYTGRSTKDIYSTPSSGNIAIGSDGSSYWLVERSVRAIP